MNKLDKSSSYKNLLNRVISIIESARKRTVRQINTLITHTYWEVGRVVLVEEQKGKKRAEYGEYLIERLSKDLTKNIGKGFTERNLRAFRQFYLTYPKLYAVRAESKIDEKNCALHSELSWTHFRLLLGIKDETSRRFYVPI